LHLVRPVLNIGIIYLQTLYVSIFSSLNCKKMLCRSWLMNNKNRDCSLLSALPRF
jgi:hypothetical protein